MSDYQRGLTAPWRVESWVTTFNETLYRAVSADWVPITELRPDPSFAEAVVASRNEGTVEQDMEALKAKYEAAMANMRAEVDRCRELFARDRDIAYQALLQTRRDLYELREKVGTITKAERVQLEGLREGDEPRQAKQATLFGVAS